MTRSTLSHAGDFARTEPPCLGLNVTVVRATNRAKTAPDGGHAMSGKRWVIHPLPLNHPCDSTQSPPPLHRFEYFVYCGRFICGIHFVESLASSCLHERKPYGREQLCHGRAGAAAGWGAVAGPRVVPPAHALHQA